MMMAVWKIAPAIAAGNTVVLKPSDTTPVTTLRLAELAAEFLPPGVLNVVCGDRDTGRALVEHPIPQMVVDHRVGAGRHGGRRSRGARRQAGAPRAGRQGPGRGLRRRRPRGRRRGHRRRRLLQRGPGLHRRHPRAGRPRHLRRLRRRAHRAGPQHHDDLRQGRRGRGRAGAAGEQRQPARARHRLPRPGPRPRRGRPPAARRQGDRGFYVEPTVVAGLRQDDEMVQRRDLRPGHHRAAVHRRGRGGRAGPTASTTGWPPASGRRTSAGRCG